MKVIEPNIPAFISRNAHTQKRLRGRVNCVFSRQLRASGSGSGTGLMPHPTSYSPLPIAGSATLEVIM